MRVSILKTEDVTPNDRRNAKAVNFGVVYGISDFGLSNNLGISRKEAKAYIETYFKRYPGIKDYMERVVREARDKGYVETLFKRRREIPDINSRNFNVRGFAERTAINSPIQGSAADILKIAMIHLDQALEAGAYKTQDVSSGPTTKLFCKYQVMNWQRSKNSSKRPWNPLSNLQYHWKPMKTKARHGMKPNKIEFVQNRKR